MKNFKVIAVAMLVMLFGAGCYGFKKATPDARPAGADAAAVFDVVPDKSDIDSVSGESEVSIDSVNMVGKVDANINLDLAVSAPEAGPEALPNAKDVFTPDLPCINPTPGHYSAQLDPALSKVGDSISRLGSSGFTVSVDKDGSFWIDATYDGWAHYQFLATCGSFNAQHGAGWDGYGGTSCPTDGFGFIGSFVSPTEARGLYKDLSWRCQVVSVGYFIATLDPVPDSGATHDTATTNEAGIVVDSGEIDR